MEVSISIRYILMNIFSSDRTACLGVLHNARFVLPFNKQLPCVLGQTTLDEIH